MQRRSPSVVSDGFVPARLVLARQARGLKQGELATAMNRAQATLSKWESGSYDHSPDFAAVAQLSDLLHVQGSWFYKPLREDGGAAFYRSLKSALHLARDKAAAKLRFVDEIAFSLNTRVEFPVVDIPDLMRDRSYRTLRPEDIDIIAAELRDYWGLSDDPIEDLLLVIENAGIAVAEDYFDSAQLDGISKWFDDRPVVLLARDKNGGVRRRFDAAHELGHMVLHRALTSDQLNADLTLVEEQAMIFAGAFLLPGGSFASDIRDLSLEAFADVKPKWKVSIGAMIKRARTLNLVSAEHERNLWKYYSYRRWRGNEPHDEGIEVEIPYNLRAAIEMVAEEGAPAIDSLVEEIGLSPEYLRQLTSVEREVFRQKEKPRPKLSVVRGGADREVPSAAND